MMTKIFNLLFLVQPIISFNYNIFNYNHLDPTNLKRLEKIFYLRNNKYSPYKSIKYNVSITKDLNITQLLKNLNNEFLRNENEIKNINNNTNFDDFDEDEDFNDDDDFKPIQIKGKLKEIGRVDPMGIFRYNKPSSTINNGDNSYRNKQTNNDDSKSDHTFEIIKNSEYTFKDIGGYHKIKDELMQTSDLLINYNKYKKFNVRVPKGIIFEGPPGNGKTLLAKCFSGELNVSFIPVCGSEFSEMYVGVGASRVRDLFKLAHNNKPCIIFIDEIDALARKRGNDMVSSNSEKDQTLNQLLVNLDGFKGSNGVFVIGATNRIDLLDPALIRPGRIDKNIFIGNPDSDTRKSIIEIHLKGKPLDKSIDISYIIEMTGGFSGAQIENLINEAMLYALRENREMITLHDFEFIANRIMTGSQSTESKFSEDIINRITVHEIGHALIGFLSKEHSRLVKVTLNLWSPRTPGYTLFESNDKDSNIHTKNCLLSHLMVLMGGRVAEEIFYGISVTTGAKLDLEQTYSLAQSMILQYGMGNQNIYPTLSDQSKFLIDQEVNKLLIEAHDGATLILNRNKDLILDCCEVLKSKSLLKPEDIINIIELKYPDMFDIYDIKKIYKF
jgi:cell division protease FtsH